ncbi:hypothetical protein [Streptomyces sp. NBC_00690]|uniref:hypothetical protein n=1 Tax=Streptomyces sp. NBC_00690 TaxID=2975808 RepID=UPI002E2B6C96|nr:hypothetical protein [Streptomyces sp. NBC_00690]
MTTALPTTDDVQALHQFIQDRTEEEWKHASAAEDLPDSHFDTIRRLSNSNKLALTGTTAYLLDTLKRGDNEQAARVWDYLTSCGEQWQEHSAWKTAWANPARAALRHP